jgi:hypothetical protein
MTDPMKEAGFLAFLYPLSEAADVRERLGSVHYVPKPSHVTFSFFSPALQNGLGSADS